MSVKRRSRIFASCCLANARTVLASAMQTPCGKKLRYQRRTVADSPANSHLCRKDRGKEGAPDRLLQSVALRRPKSVKPRRDAGNSIVLIAGITGLYTEVD